MKEALSALINKSRGFTLVETILAIFVISVGVGGIFAFLGNTIRFTPGLDNQLVASYLAQEGVEIVRNIRDSNYIERSDGGPASWDKDLDLGCPGNAYQADYNDTAPVIVCFIDGKLNLVGGFYVHDLGPSTLFQRKIIIDLTSPYQLDITVEVTWEERGNTQTFAVETQLFDWAF